MEATPSRSTVLLAAGLSVGVHALVGFSVVRLGDGILQRQPRRAEARLVLTPLASEVKPPIPVSMPEPKPDPKPEQSTPPPPPPPPTPPPAPPEEPDIIKPGIDDSTADIETWKGHNEATEHQGLKSSVEQAGLTPEPGAPGETTPGEEAQRPPAESEPKPEPAATPAEVTPPSPAPAEPKPQPPEPVPAEPESKPPAPEAAHTPPQETAPVVSPTPTPPPQFDEAPVAPQEQPGELRPAESPPELNVPPERVEVTDDSRAVLPATPKSSPPSRTVLEPPLPVSMPEDRPGVNELIPEPPAPTPAEPTTPESATPPATANAGGSRAEPGLLADDESVPTSLKDPIAVRPGKVLARKGLNIRTSHPRFTATTLALTQPRNPLVRITFGRNGKVQKAEFVEGHSTGYADVDKPLLDSLHRWVARGEQLAKIPANPPDSGLTMEFRILFDAQ